MRSVTIRAAVPFIGRGVAHEAHNTTRSQETE